MRLFLAAWALGLAACGPKQLRSGAAPVRHYSITMDMQTRTEAPGAPEALRQQLVALGDGEEALRLRASLEDVDRYRDGSEGVVIRFDGEPVQASSGARPLGLAGRSVLMRRFGDGEILQLSDVDHLVGGDRQGEVLDLLFPLLSPQPPDLRPGETVGWAARWPLRVDGERGQRGLLQADWRYVGLEGSGPTKTHHVSYAGTWETLGSDRVSQVPRGVRGEGSASGEIWLSQDLELVRHEFSWERQVVIRGPALEGEERRELFQHQSFEGAIEALP